MESLTSALYSIFSILRRTRNCICSPGLIPSISGVFSSSPQTVIVIFAPVHIPAPTHNPPGVNTPISSPTVIGSPQIIGLIDEEIPTAALFPVFAL